MALAPYAVAWKPTTHVLLADIAYADAADDGKVTLMRLNKTTGEATKLGDYEVEPALLAALQKSRAQYRAGVLGPDAFPDIATGQSAIHPGDDPKTGGTEGNDPGEGSDAWLKYLYRTSRGESPQVQAWVAGFMTHAAGDLFAHTFVNHYAGGEFEPGTNAARHIVLESYIGKRAVDVADYDASIDGVEKYIAKNLCHMKPDSELSKLLVGPGAEKSPPAFFANLRKDLTDEIAAYDRRSPAQQASYNVSYPGRIQYLRAWVKDIDRGLDAWPGFSMRLASHLMFNPKGMDKPAADAEVKAFMDDYLLSMLGLPDAAGQVRKFAEALSLALLTKPQRDAIAQMEKDFLNQVCTEAFGISYDDFVQMVKNPETSFDDTLGPKSKGSPTAHNITLKDFNHLVLELDDDGYSKPDLRWDWQKFPPAYNTVMLTKISFLAPAEVNRVLIDLGAPVDWQLKPGAHVLFDFHNSLDDDNQWHVNSGKLIFERAGVYEHLFKTQIGERR